MLLARQVAHLLVHDPLASFADFDQQAANRVPMGIRHPLCGADRIALDQAIDDLGSAGERFMVLSLAFVYVIIYIWWLCLQGEPTMNFQKATDILLESVTLEDLADALGVSVQAIRQARVSQDSTAFRNPPRGWERAVVKLSERRVRSLSKLINPLKNQALH